MDANLIDGIDRYTDIVNLTEGIDIYIDIAMG